MYGISNGQQKGSGGGGGAASYKAIKSTLTPDDWQEVAKQPYFVGSNAMEWPEDSAFGGAHAKRSEAVIGLITGVDYTISATIDGQVYTKTAQMVDPSETGGTKLLMFYFAGVGDDGSIPNEDELIAVQIIDDASAMVSGVNSFVVIKAPATVTNYTITSFSGPGLSSNGKAIISDAAIKVNSAVTLYVNTGEKIAAVEKTDGSVTLTAPSIPTIDIPYSLEIVGTDSEGLFELVNGYVPVSSDYNNLSNTPVINQDLSESGFTPVKDTYYRHTGTTDDDYTKGVIYKCVQQQNPNKPLLLSSVISTDEIEDVVYEIIDDVVEPLFPHEKNITNASANVLITGSASPYLFTVTDSDVTVRKFVRLYPKDADTEAWLNTHTISSIITENSGSFTFNVDTATLPSAFSIKYIIESPQ